MTATVWRNALPEVVEVLEACESHLHTSTAIAAGTLVPVAPVHPSAITADTLACHLLSNVPQFTQMTHDTKRGTCFELQFSPSSSCRRFLT